MPSETNPEFDSCEHEHTGRVSWPEDLVATARNQNVASIYTCPDPDCVDAAVTWVQVRTGHRGVYVELTPYAAAPEPTGRASIGALYRNGVLRSFRQCYVVCTCHHELLQDPSSGLPATFDTAESALHAAVRQYGWVLLDDGRLLCTGTTAPSKPRR